MMRLPMSVEEMRSYFSSGRIIPEEWFGEWEKNSRAGIRRLAVSLHKQQRERLAEKKRLLSLYRYERELWAQGRILVAGVDEVGRGPLAGPVVAAAVILPGEVFLPGLNDSKKVPEKRRSQLADAIKKTALSWSLGVVSAAEIDRVNIRQAGLLAMRLAINGLRKEPDYLLVDGFPIPGILTEQMPIVGGDGLSASIAAASIIAKVARDEMMLRYERKYPGYGFARNKGYGTKEHLEALRSLGPSAIHRRTFLRREG